MQSHELGICTFKDRKTNLRQNVALWCIGLIFPSSYGNAEKKWDMINRSQGPPGNPGTTSDRFKLRY